MKKFLEKLRRRKVEEEEFVVLPFEEEPQEKINIRIENFGGLSDVDRIVKLVRQGNIVFLRTKTLQKRDIGHLQAGITKLKKVCDQYGWDIAGTEEGYVLIVPRFAEIVRE
ncbi:MAG: hypothetical protein B6U78_00170 [Candidatus Aenigmarchaeota archaeon ex4484_224]|nr:MAG: hypothetical protein B6U78_00170 [Candidatus Aenigmarchaeota archaeon ex4484_224]